MVILIASLAAIIAIFTPFWGLIFTLIYSEKCQNKKSLFYTVFSGIAITFFLLKMVDFIGIFDVIFGVGIISFFYSKTLHEKFDYMNAILVIYFANIIKAIVKFFFFEEKFVQLFESAMQNSQAIIATYLEKNLEKFALMTEMIEKTTTFFIKHHLGIEVALMTVAAYIASLLISRKSPIKWKHNVARFPFFMVYFLIAGLMLILLSNYRIIGTNLLIALAPIFLIQGSTILDFFWGNFFRKSKFLQVILIFSIVFNYYVLLLVMIVGLIDFWFDIRKLKNNGGINENNLSK